MARIEKVVAVIFITTTINETVSFIFLLLLGQKDNESTKQVNDYQTSEISVPMFFTNELNAKRRLAGLKIMSKYVASSKQCMEECLKVENQRCKSVNFAKTANNDGHLCEVNAAMNPYEVPKFVEDPGFVHYSLI